MAIDPNETAHNAFGYAPAPPPPPSTAERSAPSRRPLADWWTRAGAFVLDQLLMGTVAVVIVMAVLLVVGDPDSSSAELIAYAIALPITSLYAPLLMRRGGARNGQTIGKQAVGIRVVRTTGEPVTFWNGILRTVFAQQFLTAITLYVYALFDYLWPLRDAQNQALHDKIAKTWVVRTAPSGGSSAAVVPTASPSAVPRPDETPVQGWLPPSAGA